MKIFGDRTLNEITDSRLFRLEQCTLPWWFDIRHLHGKSSHTANATSRHPSRHPWGGSHYTKLPIPPAPSFGPPGDHNYGGASPCHCLLAWNVKGQSGDARGMCRLQQEHSLPRCPCPRRPCPSTPFEVVFSDFFDWVEVLSSPAGTTLGGSVGLVRHLRSFFSTSEVPEELCSDGSSEFPSKDTKEFLQLWGVRHCISSVTFPQSNGRADVAVKTAKQLLTSNTGPTGSLDHNRFLRTMLKLMNTPTQIAISLFVMPYNRRYLLYPTLNI